LLSVVCSYNGYYFHSYRIWQYYITILRLFYPIMFVKNCWIVGSFLTILISSTCLLFLFCWKNTSYLFGRGYIWYGLWNNSSWTVEYGIVFLTHCGNINASFQRIWVLTELKLHVRNFVTLSLSPYVRNVMPLKSSS
jgi:hypothetical protein